MVVAVESLAASQATIAASLAVPVKAREKAAPKPPAAPKPTKTATIYTVDKAVFGEKTVRAVLIDLDAASVPLSADNFEMCISALAVVRHGAQGTEGPPTYRAAECAHLRAVLAAHKPTSVGRAICNAAADSFWSSKTLSMDIVARHIASWLTLAKAPPKKANVQAEATRLLGLLRAKAPIVANDIDAADLTYMNETAMAEHLERIRGECQSRKIPTETT